jgi:hypothetical protein
VELFSVWGPRLEGTKIKDRTNEWMRGVGGEGLTHGGGLLSLSLSLLLFSAGVKDGWGLRLFEFLATVFSSPSIEQVPEQEVASGCR